MLELLCAGANPQAMQVVNQRLRELEQRINGRPPRAAAKEALELQGKLRLSKTLIEAACKEWPVSTPPAIPAEPTIPEASSLGVVQLKDILRRHGQKVAGRKAELIERVRARNLLTLDHEDKLREHKKEKEAVLLKRSDMQLRLEARATRLRSVVAEAALKAPTDAEIDAVAGKDDGSSGAGLRSLRDRSRSPRRSIDARPICTHFLRGQCHFGFRCRYRHEARPEPAARSVLGPLCCYLQQGRCRFGSSCDFSHEKPYERRACQFGLACRLGHR